jgi:hypothetical protein
MILINIQYSVLHASLWLLQRWDLVGTVDPWPSTSGQWAHLSNGSIVYVNSDLGTQRPSTFWSLYLAENVSSIHYCTHIRFAEETTAIPLSSMQPVACHFTENWQESRELRNTSQYHVKYSWMVDGYSTSHEIRYFYGIRRAVGFAKQV